MPERMCLGCRGRAEKADLVRLVVTRGRLLVDAAQTAPGRGAYLHAGCGRRVARGGRLSRALRTQGLDAAAVRDVLAEVDAAADRHVLPDADSAPPASPVA